MYPPLPCATWTETLLCTLTIWYAVYHSSKYNDSQASTTKFSTNPLVLAACRNDTQGAAEEHATSLVPTAEKVTHQLHIQPSARLLCQIICNLQDFRSKMLQRMLSQAYCFCLLVQSRWTQQNTCVNRDDNCWHWGRQRIINLLLLSFNFLGLHWIWLFQIRQELDLAGFRNSIPAVARARFGRTCFRMREKYSWQN